MALVARLKYLYIFQKLRALHSNTSENILHECDCVYIYRNIYVWYGLYRM